MYLNLGAFGAVGTVDWSVESSVVSWFEGGVQEEINSRPVSSRQRYVEAFIIWEIVFGANLHRNI